MHTTSSLQSLTTSLPCRNLRHAKQRESSLLAHTLHIAGNRVSRPRSRERESSSSCSVLRSRFSFSHLSRLQHIRRHSTRPVVLHCLRDVAPTLQCLEERQQVARVARRQGLVVGAHCLRGSDSMTFRSKRACCRLIARPLVLA